LLPLSGEIREGLHLFSKTIVPKLHKDELLPLHNRRLVNLKEEIGSIRKNQRMNQWLLQRTMKGIVGIAKCQNDLPSRSAPALTSIGQKPDDKTLFREVRTGNRVHVSQWQHMASLLRKRRAHMGHPIALEREKGTRSSTTRLATILADGNHPGKTKDAMTAVVQQKMKW